MFAAAAMSLSSVCVVSNALRLKLFKPRRGALAEISVPIETESKIVKTETKEVVKTMKKTMKIEGMMCEHCSGRVEKALCALDGVTAKVDLEAKTAMIETEGRVDDDALKAAVADAGYEVVSLD